MRDTPPKFYTWCMELGVLGKRLTFQTALPPTILEP